MSEPKFDDLAREADKIIKGDLRRGHEAISGPAIGTPESEVNPMASTGVINGEVQGGAIDDFRRGLRENKRDEIHEAGSERSMAEGELGASRIEDFFSSENKGFFGRMSEGAKKIMSSAYDGLYKIPGVSRVVGKMEIAYNQFWMDRHEKKAVAQKGKMDDLDLQRGALDLQKQAIEANLKELQRLGVPKVESLQLQLKDIDKQQAKLLGKKDSIQSKFEARENKVKLYANERDGIADKLIGRYDEKLKPLEQELEKMQTCRDQEDLVIAAMEVRHKDELGRIAELESKKSRIEELMAGSKKGEIKKAVAGLAEMIARSHANIKAEREGSRKKQDEINRKIAGVEAKANPYRDKREQFVRVKDGRPLDIEMEVRKKRQEFEGREGTEAHVREEAPVSYGGGRGDSEGVGAGRTLETENYPERDNKFTVADHISALNSYLQENGNADEKKMAVDPREFIRSMKMLLSSESRLDFEDFKKILGRYYKYKKIPLGNLDKVSKAAKERAESQKE